MSSRKNERHEGIAAKGPRDDARVSARNRWLQRGRTTIEERDGYNILRLYLCRGLVAKRSIRTDVPDTTIGARFPRARARNHTAAAAAFSVGPTLSLSLTPSHTNRQANKPPNTVAAANDDDDDNDGGGGGPVRGRRGGGGSRRGGGGGGVARSLVLGRNALLARPNSFRRNAPVRSCRNVGVFPRRVCAPQMNAAYNGSNVRCRCT